MRIYLDFDDTLVGRMTFFHDYYTPILLSSGSTQREIDVSYTYFVNNQKLFSPKEQMEISGWREEKKEEALFEIENIIRQHRALIFPDVVEVLRSLRSRGHTLILLTYGQQDFQKQKIIASGTAHLFDEIIITHEDKVEIIRRDHEGEPIVFVDDKTDFIIRLAEQFPEVQTFHMCRKGTPVPVCEKGKCPAGHEIESLEELLKFIP